MVSVAIPALAVSPGFHASALGQDYRFPVLAQAQDRRFPDVGITQSVQGLQIPAAAGLRVMERSAFYRANKRSSSSAATSSSVCCFCFQLLFTFTGVHRHSRLLLCKILWFFLSVNQVFGLFVQAGDGTTSLTDVHVFLILLNVTD